jgi:hypothetical protein
MNIEGRVRLYTNKFGFKNSDQLLYEGVRNIFLQARALIDDDDELFLQETAQTIKKYGWFPLLT